MVRKLTHRLVAVALLVMLGSAGAGPTIVSGDVTPLFKFPSSGAPIAGNIQFFTNILGTGTSVLVLDESFLAGAPTETNTFYGGLPGVSSALFSGTITGSTLSGVDLFVVPFLDNAFSASEINEIGNFLAASGTLFITGESAGATHGATSNGFVNAALSGLGSGLGLIDDNLDPGSGITASGSQIASHPLTAGVSTFGYGATSEVSGGTPLFFASTGAPFLACENCSTALIPAPAAFPLFISGLLGLGGFGYSRSKDV